MALLLVFMAPGILAVVFYFNPAWLSGLPTNKGQLMHATKPLNILNNATDKWHLVVWCPSGCDNDCLKALDEMARVRLALGRRLYDVDLWQLLGEKQVACDKVPADFLKKNAIKSRLLSKAEQAEHVIFQAGAKVFLVDPNQYVVLQYGAENKPADVFQDLKRLLNTREQA